MDGIFLCHFNTRNGALFLPAVHHRLVKRFRIRNEQAQVGLFFEAHPKKYYACCVMILHPLKTAVFWQVTGLASDF
jgi:hypothetical protein